MLIGIRLVKWLLASGLILLGLVLVTTGMGFAISALIGQPAASLIIRAAAFLLAHAQYPALAAYPVAAGILLILCGLLLFAV